MKESDQVRSPSQAFGEARAPMANLCPYSQNGLAFNLFSRCVPSRDSLVEIGVVGKVATNRCIVAELLILNGSLPAANCIEKVRLVIGEITVARWHGVRLRRVFYGRSQRRG